MGIIEVEHSEIRQVIKNLEAGKIDKETAALLFKGYSECGKRVDQFLKVVSMTINHGKAARQIISKNIISEGSAMGVDLMHMGEMMKCPEQGDLLINRDECLDYSGATHHIDACQKCEQFSRTRKQICPK